MSGGKFTIDNQSEPPEWLEFNLRNRLIGLRSTSAPGRIALALEKALQAAYRRHDGLTPGDPGWMETLEIVELQENRLHIAGIVFSMMARDQPRNQVETTDTSHETLVAEAHDSALRVVDLCRPTLEADEATYLTDLVMRLSTAFRFDPNCLQLR